MNSLLVVRTRPAVCALLLAVGCGGDREATATDVPADTDTDTDTDIDTDGPAFVGDPTVSANDLGAGLTAWLDVQTTEATTLIIEVSDPGGVRSWTVDDPSTSHHHLLLGLAPDADHEVTVTARADGSGVTSDPVPWRSEPLPAVTPDLTVTGDPSLAEPGVTLLNAAGWLWMFDGHGEPVWYAPAVPLTHAVGVTDRGTILYQVGRSAVEEIALSGEVLRSWKSNRAELPAGAALIDRMAVHHDVFEMPGGTFLTLSVEDRVLDDYPASETIPGPTNATAAVIGDTILEFDDSGAVLTEWTLFDVLDPYRISYNGLRGTYWDAFFPYPDTEDWTHGNSVWFDDVRDEVLVSLRHQDAVVALSYPSGELSWIFAPDANWPPSLQPYVLQPEQPTDEPAYHQHSASITEVGTLLMFDNGNDRASAYEPKIPPLERYSRCLEVSIDHAAGTWTTAWSWGEHLVGEQESHFSGSLGDCDRLPDTGNHLITFGNLSNPDLPPVKVVEVDPEGTVVWELAIERPSSGITPALFRAERVTGVIPGR